MIKKLISKLKQKSFQIGESYLASETNLILNGKILSELMRNKPYTCLSDYEFKVFSQFGDDGIVQYLIHNVDIPNKTFIEFGVSHYEEANTRFLLMNNNWAGLIMDGSQKHIKRIQTSHYYWKYNLTAKHAFIDRDNINPLLSSWVTDPDIGLLHIDLDGNDYYIWDAITEINPRIVIMEYNSYFGTDRPISTPYDASFNMFSAHYSMCYFGASLPALCHLANQKNYSFIGCNSAGNNAYFIRNDVIPDSITPISHEKGFVKATSRTSRNQSGKLTTLSYTESQKLIKGMPIYDVATDSLGTF